MNEQPTAITSFRDSYAFLSNFYPSKARTTLEHFFQAAKTLAPAERAFVLAARTPAEAKRRGRQVTLRSNWDALKIDIMRELLYAKFAPHTPIAEKLLATGYSTLVEGNTWGDRFWGATPARTHEPEIAVGTMLRWEDDLVGSNHLGILLMEVRMSLAYLYTNQ